MLPYYERAKLRFSCTRCGRCCATGGGYFVYLVGMEHERIRRYLGLSGSWFRRRYLERLPGGELVLAAGADDRCIFLDDEGSCRVYPARPLQCRTYPFWPELVATRRAWLGETRRCEGINQGEVIPLEKIRRQLRRLG